MKEIILTKGYSTLVDDDDYTILSKYKWCYSHGVAVRRCRVSEKQYTGTIIYMHREIMGLLSKDGWEVDHINGNSLDNRRCNLRVCTHQENTFNKIGSRSKYGYKGVYPPGPRDRGYQSKIMHNGISIHLGVYKTQEEAAIAYDNKAKEIFGKFARVNFT